jgi:hypothetical protein
MPLSPGIPSREYAEVQAVLPKLVQVVSNYEVSNVKASLMLMKTHTWE